MRDNEDEMIIPTIATIPHPTGVRGGYQPEAGVEKPAAPTTGSGVDSPNGDEADATVIARASLVVNQFRQEREKLQVMVTEATLALESANRRSNEMQRENMELKNNLQTLQTTCEELRQEASDMRALFASIRAQFEHFEIPLPVRKRANKLNPKNGEGP